MMKTWYYQRFIYFPEKILYKNHKVSNLLVLLVTQNGGFDARAFRYFTLSSLGMGTRPIDRKRFVFSSAGFEAKPE